MPRTNRIIFPRGSCRATTTRPAGVSTTDLLTLPKLEIRHSQRNFWSTEDLRPLHRRCLPLRPSYAAAVLSHTLATSCYRRMPAFLAKLVVGRLDRVQGAALP